MQNSIKSWTSRKSSKGIACDRDHIGLSIQSRMTNLLFGLLRLVTEEIFVAEANNKGAFAGPSVFEFFRKQGDESDNTRWKHSKGGWRHEKKATVHNFSFLYVLHEHRFIVSSHGRCRT